MTCCKFSTGCYFNCDFSSYKRFLKRLDNFRRRLWNPKKNPGSSCGFLPSTSDPTRSQSRHNKQPFSNLCPSKRRSQPCSVTASKLSKKIAPSLLDLNPLKSCPKRSSPSIPESNPIKNCAPKNTPPFHDAASSKISSRRNSLQSQDVLCCKSASQRNSTPFNNVTTRISSQRNSLPAHLSEQKVEAEKLLKKLSQLNKKYSECPNSLDRIPEKCDSACTSSKNKPNSDNLKGQNDVCVCLQSFEPKSFSQYNCKEGKAKSGNLDKRNNSKSGHGSSTLEKFLKNDSKKKHHRTSERHKRHSSKSPNGESRRRKHSSEGRKRWNRESGCDKKPRSEHAGSRSSVFRSTSKSYQQIPLPTDNFTRTQQQCFEHQQIDDDQQFACFVQEKLKNLKDNVLYCHKKLQNYVPKICITVDRENRSFVLKQGKFCEQELNRLNKGE